MLALRRAFLHRLFTDIECKPPSHEEDNKLLLLDAVSHGSCAPDLLQSVQAHTMFWLKVHLVHNFLLHFQGLPIEWNSTVILCNSSRVPLSDIVTADNNHILHISVPVTTCLGLSAQKTLRELTLQQLLGAIIALSTAQAPYVLEKDVFQAAEDIWCQYEASFSLAKRAFIVNLDEVQKLSRVGFVKDRDFFYCLCNMLDVPDVMVLPIAASTTIANVEAIIDKSSFKVHAVPIGLLSHKDIKEILSDKQICIPDDDNSAADMDLYVWPVVLEGTAGVPRLICDAALINPLRQALENYGDSSQEKEVVRSHMKLLFGTVTRELLNGAYSDTASAFSSMPKEQQAVLAICSAATLYLDQDTVLMPGAETMYRDVSEPIRTVADFESRGLLFPCDHSHSQKMRSYMLPRVLQVDNYISKLASECSQFLCNRTRDGADMRGKGLSINELHNTRIYMRDAPSTPIAKGQQLERVCAMSLWVRYLHKLSMREVAPGPVAMRKLSYDELVPVSLDDLLPSYTAGALFSGCTIQLCGVVQLKSRFPSAAAMEEVNSFRGDDKRNYLFINGASAKYADIFTYVQVNGGAHAGAAAAASAHAAVADSREQILGIQCKSFARPLEHGATCQELEKCLKDVSRKEQKRDYSPEWRVWHLVIVCPVLAGTVKEHTDKIMTTHKKACKNPTTSKRKPPSAELTLDNFSFSDGLCPDKTAWLPQHCMAFFLRLSDHEKMQTLRSTASLTQGIDRVIRDQADHATGSSDPTTTRGR